MTVRSAEPDAYSYWRVWVDEDAVRVARDWLNAPPPGPRLQPQHLEIVENGYVSWRPHEQGAVIPALEMGAFVTWLDQGGAA